MVEELRQEAEAGSEAAGPQLWFLGRFRFPLIDGSSSGKPALVQLGPTGPDVSAWAHPPPRAVSKHLTPNPEL